ncbi:MAG: lysophospholipid acyltransferase family protein [Luteolibacter sp.]
MAKFDIVAPTPMSSNKASEIRGSRRTSILGTMAGWGLKALTATLRIELHDRCGIGDAAKCHAPVIYALWHNRIGIVPAVWQRLCGGHRRAVVMASASHDGDLVAQAMKVFGLEAVRGSSSRRGVAALIGLLRELKGGKDACITPDGPRGPRYQLQPGVIALAQSSGASVVPVHVRFGKQWVLKTWDRFVIPMPFSRVQVIFDHPIQIPRQLEPEAFEQTRSKIESILLAGVSSE